MNKLLRAARTKTHQDQAAPAQLLTTAADCVVGPSRYRQHAHWIFQILQHSGPRLIFNEWVLFPTIRRFFHYILTTAWTRRLFLHPTLKAITVKRVQTGISAADDISIIWNGSIRFRFMSNTSHHPNVSVFKDVVSLHVLIGCACANDHVDSWNS